MNILICNNFIAHLTQQFGAITTTFIVPDQATVNNANPCYGTGGGCTNTTTDMGSSFNVGGFGPGGLIDMPAPCVCQLRIVPDYLSMSPVSGDAAPCAGASRHQSSRTDFTAPV